MNFHDQWALAWSGLNSPKRNTRLSWRRSRAGLTKVRMRRTDIFLSHDSGPVEVEHREFVGDPA